MANKDSKAAAKAPVAASKKAPKTVVKTVEELQADLAKLRADHLESRKSHRQGELVNPHVLSVQRKGIARLLTAINQAKEVN